MFFSLPPIVLMFVVFYNVNLNCKIKAMLSLLEVDLHLGGLRSHIAADYDFTSQRIKIYIFLRTTIYTSADYGLHLDVTDRRVVH